ncbi:VWA domain-containing protein, partial [Streptomyces coeruleorubidus]|uniref:VWA domain-containing protein n=1 Tax=Streptomyces coeruleorubidus TaxID=116188 RepID=UPI0034118E3D
PTVAEKPTVEEKQAVVEEPVVEEPTVAEKQAVVEEPTVAEEPVVSEEPAVEEPTVEEPTVAEKPTVEEKQAVVEEPVVEEPTVAEKQAVSEKPTVAEEPTVEGEPAAAGKPASDEEPEASAEGKPTPEAEPKAESKAESKADAVDAPAAADGDSAPQGPPAPDDESSTGGAGGNDDTAEAGGEAEPKPTPDTEPKPAPTPIPAVPLTRVKTRAPSLTTAYKAAATTLKQHDLTGTRARVYLILDRSASMRPYYKDGSAQALAEQTLALAAHLDPEATVPVFFFSTELDGTGEITLTDHENKIDDLHAGLGRMGRTSYHAAVEAVLAHHGKEATPTTPALVVFQTDGAPDAKTPATQSLTEAAKTHPAVFFSFVAFGDPENKAFDYLRKLKTPNTSHFLAGETPRELTDKELYEGVLANWRP